MLARVEVREDGHRVLTVSRLAVRDLDERRPGEGRTSVKHGGHVVDLDDESDDLRWAGFQVGCACGSSFLLLPSTQLAPRPLMEDRGGFLHRVEGRTVPPPSLILMDPLPTHR